MKPDSSSSAPMATRRIGGTTAFGASTAFWYGCYGNPYRYGALPIPPIRPRTIRNSSASKNGSSAGSWDGISWSPLPGIPIGPASRNLGNCPFSTMEAAYIPAASPASNWKGENFPWSNGILTPKRTGPCRSFGYFWRARKKSGTIFKNKMETLQTILEKIPIRNDLASHIILLGVVQGFFLALVIFLRTTRGSALWLYGWALLFQSLVCLDIYLCYTGLIKHMISLNDSTEPLVLLIAPSLYLFFYALLKRKSVTLRTHWPHFVFPLLYGISQTPYYLSPMAVKLNSYVAAFHRELGFVPVPGEFHRTQYFSKDLFRWMVLLSFLLYFVLSLRLLYGTLGKGALGKKARE